MIRKIKSLIYFLLILALGLGGVIAYTKPEVFNVFFQPCTAPIEYSLGTIDPKFKISHEQFLKDIDQAVLIWEDGVSLDLFKYSPEGKLKINLIYDYRQEVTDKLKSIGVKIDDSQSSYNNLKIRYDAESADYQKRKAVLDAAVHKYNQDVEAYEQSVKYWNSHGGASSSTAADLNDQRDQLNVRAAAINREKAELNALVDSINGLANILNRMSQELNLNVSTYNKVGQSRGEEFEEGLYTSSSSGKKIDIYEFNDTNQLVRVLAHELGHALNLEHVDDKEAIMYYLNQSKNNKLTLADIAELKKACRLEN
jgi:chromosome segregation ATPase